MAMGLPTLATDWGGPADYLDASCGVLVPPATREDFVAGVRDGMIELARSPARRRALGSAARSKVRARFDWERKVDAILAVYEEARRSWTEPMWTRGSSCDSR
jgi:glycosyltransferase involved in cell wall biosynthesis